MKFGLVGKGIEYSLSKEWFNKKGYEYTIYDTDNLEETIYKMFDDGITGFNVTTPYKQEIIKYLDYRMKPDLNSVNSVKIENGQLIGDSFDGIACISEIQKLMDNHDNWEWYYPENIAILGNGGVVPSILYELSKYLGTTIPSRLINATVTVFGRTNKNLYKNEELLKSFSSKNYDIIINTIPFKTGFDINFNNKKQFIYYDLNYADDRLVNKAKKNSHCSWAVNGYNMLENQALYSLCWWTNKSVLDILTGNK